MTTPDPARDTVTPRSSEPPEADLASPQGDHALDVLLSVRETIAPHLPTSLIENCYRIQREHQYSQDKQTPLQVTRDVVETYVNKDLESSDGGDV